MPKVLSYTPEWLSRPSSGYKLFAPQAETNAQPAHADPRSRRTIATRGSEVFVAIGHEIRWADLSRLKEDPEASHRTLRVSIPLPISRLTISADGTYLAVSTSHTVHVVVLPDSALLETNDTSPIKPKSFQVGPTAHALEAPKVDALRSSLSFSALASFFRSIDNAGSVNVDRSARFISHRRTAPSKVTVTKQRP